jgi:hypothetical protein
MRDDLDRLSLLFFFFERHGNVGIRAQPYDIVLDRSDKATGNEVVMPDMGRFSALDLGARVLFGQLDAVALDMVDGADMDAIGANDFGMFLDLRKVGHSSSPEMGSPGITAVAPFCAVGLPARHPHIHLS